MKTRPVSTGFMTVGKTVASNRKFLYSGTEKFEKVDSIHFFNNGTGGGCRATKRCNEK
jgi:hypothetical protein